MENPCQRQRYQIHPHFQQEISINCGKEICVHGQSIQPLRPEMGLLRQKGQNCHNPGYPWQGQRYQGKSKQLPGSAGELEQGEKRYFLSCLLQGSRRKELAQDCLRQRTLYQFQASLIQVLSIKAWQEICVYGQGIQRKLQKMGLLQYERLERYNS